MSDPSYVHDLAIVLGVAAGAGILFRSFKQPGILGYLAAGFIVGPYVPLLFANQERVHALSELGVVLVMFVIGLELRLTRLFKVLPVAGFTALVQISTLAWSGFMVGILLGLNRVESIFLGAAIAVSSTMIVSKMFEEKDVPNDIRGFVLGILVLQDVAAIGLIAATTAIAESGAVSAQSMMGTMVRLLGVLAVWIAAGLLVVPRLFRWIARLNSPETLVISSVGLCFAFGMMAEAMSYSVALGAFVAGLLVAESGRGMDIEHLIHPVKNIFAAVFFVSIGMTVNPMLAFEHLWTSIIVFVVIVLAQLCSVTISGMLSGKGVRISVSSGLALGQIGEFAFIIIAIGVSHGVVRDSLQPVIVSAAILTSMTTPFMMNWAPSVVAWVDRMTPKRLKGSLVIYESWFAGQQTPTPDEVSNRKRALVAIGLDALVWLLLLLAGVHWHLEIESWLIQQFGLGSSQAAWVLILILIIVSIPPCYGVVRNTQLLIANVLARIEKKRKSRDRPMTESAIMFMKWGIRLAVFLAIGAPAAAILRPSMSASVIVPLLAVVVLGGCVFLWQSAGRWDQEIRSEAQRLVDLLASYRIGDPLPIQPASFFPDIERMDGVLLEAGMPAVGKTLADVNLRATTGALVVAIHCDDEDIVMPTGSQILRENDLVMVTGSQKAIARARQQLTGVAPNAADD